MSAKSTANVDAFAADLRSRLGALARMHDLTMPDLTSAGAAGPVTTVAALIGAIVAPHQHDRASGIAISGSDVPLSGTALTSLALLLHELTTNAAKYGTLSSLVGQLTIDIAAREDLLHIDWQERGSAPHPE